jgi:hypothetical protein
LIARLTDLEGRACYSAAKSQHHTRVTGLNRDISREKQDIDMLSEDIR